MSGSSSSGGKKGIAGLFGSRVEHEGVAEEELLAGDWVLAGEDTGSLYAESTTEVIAESTEEVTETVAEPANDEDPVAVIEPHETHADESTDHTADTVTADAATTEVLNAESGDGGEAEEEHISDDVTIIDDADPVSSVADAAIVRLPRATASEITKPRDADQTSDADDSVDPEAADQSPSPEKPSSEDVAHSVRPSNVTSLPSRSHADEDHADDDTEQPDATRRLDAFVDDDVDDEVHVFTADTDTDVALEDGAFSDQVDTNETKVTNETGATDDTSLFDDTQDATDPLLVAGDLDHLTEDGDLTAHATEDSATGQADETTSATDLPSDSTEFSDAPEDPEHTSGEDFLSPDGPEPDPVDPPVDPTLDNVVRLRPKTAQDPDSLTDDVSEGTVTDDATTIESPTPDEEDTDLQDTDNDTTLESESVEDTDFVDGDYEKSDDTTEANRDVELGTGWLSFGRTLSNVWAALLVVVLGLAGLVAIIMTVAAPESGTQAQRLPSTAYSEQYKAKIAELGAESPPAVLAVVTRGDGQELSAVDREFAQSITNTAQLVDRGDVKAPVTPAVVSPDEKAALIRIPVAGDLDNEQNAVVMDTLRERIVAEGNDVRVEFAGGPAIQKDTGETFKGADVTLLLSTLAIVAFLLLLTYRSPILWIFPLLVVAIVDRAASLLAGRVADYFGMVVDGSTLGITNVLVLGAGTNYALLLTSRYREELQLRSDRREALARAVAGAGPAILASNITVVLALMMLLFAVLPGSRTLGLVAGTMLLFAMVCVLLLLPAVYALLPRFVFWPFIPRPKTALESPAANTWERIAAFVCRKPVAVLVLSLTALGLLAGGLSGSTIGLKPAEQFTNKPPSVLATETLATHFGQGAGGNIQALVPTETAQTLAGKVRELKRVKDVAIKAVPGHEEEWSHLTVTSSAEPGSKESLRTALLVRDRISSLSTPAIFVGGQEIEEAQYRDLAEADRSKIIGLILLVVFIVLVFLLKSIIAPVLLLIATSLSAFAAVGAGVWVSTNVLKYPAVDTGVFLFAFLFLIALGIDYTIFLMDRAKQEAQRLSTKAAVVRAVGATGGVITSAGVVLAAVFVVLGVLPLVILAQLGAIVCIGILLDTFLVRTLVVPAMCAFVGEKIWWPQSRALAKK